MLWLAAMRMGCVRSLKELAAASGSESELRLKVRIGRVRVTYLSLVCLLPQVVVGQ